MNKASKLPKVAVIGRTNVGKSTFINRILQKKLAIVEDRAGVTRDRVEYLADWDNLEFVLVDTGGFEFTDDKLFGSVKEQAEFAIQDCDYIFFVFDAQVGVSDHDYRIVELLRKIKKPVFLVCNKADHENIQYGCVEFYNLGLGKPYPVSSLHGIGVADLLEDFATKIRKDKKDVPKIAEKAKKSAENKDVSNEEKPGAAAGLEENADLKNAELLDDVSVDEEDAEKNIEDESKFEEESEIPRIAIVGKPNAGKSSLLNGLLAKNRSVVNSMQGTTRDPVSDYITVNDRTWQLVDTAGIRRRSKRDIGADFYAFVRTQRVIENSDIVVLLIDCLENVTDQDLRIVNSAIRLGKGIIVCPNKWDLLEENFYFERSYEQLFGMYEWLPRINISAKNGKNIFTIFDVADRVYKNLHKRVTTAELNKLSLKLFAMNPHPLRGGKQPKIQYISQVSTNPIKFVAFATGFIEDSYKRFMLGAIRDTFHFEYVPMLLSVRVKERRSRK